MQANTGEEKIYEGLQAYFNEYLDFGYQDDDALQKANMVGVKLKIMSMVKY